MLTITLDPSRTVLNIRSAYAYGTRIKQIPYAKWNRELKLWQVPLSMLDLVQKNFAGEIYFKTPLWEIKGEPAPDVIGDYELDARITLPEMKLQLYPYQQYGAKFMIDRLSKTGFVINADGCGLGKTPQAITTLQWFSKSRNLKKILLIVKKSIKVQWMRELEKFSDLPERYKVCITGDTKKKREVAYKEATEAESAILITNYHNFLADTEMIHKYSPDFAIIDEAHCVKSKDGVMNNNIAKVIRNIPAVFLTGTPIMSRPGDIFGIISMSDPYYFNRYTALDDQWKTFKARYIVTEFSFGHESVIGARNLDELRDMCQQVTIRRTMDEVAVTMPEIVEKEIRIEPDEAQLSTFSECAKESTEMQNAYTEYDGRTDDWSKEQRFKLSNLMKGLIAIKQVLATDPAISRMSKSNMVKPYMELLPKNYKCSPKTEAITDTVSEILDSGEKVILFSRFMTVAKYFADHISKTLKCETLSYTGAEGQEERERNIDLFKNSPEHNVLCGTDAMAEGLNLERARHVINIDLPDTYAIYQQRVGRARRVSSQYDSVIAYNFITMYSWDENRFSNLAKNKDLDGALIAADSAQSAALAVVSNTPA